MGVTFSRQQYITILNQYPKTIQYKIDVQKPLLTVKQTDVETTIAAASVQIGAKVAKMEQNEWIKVKTEFSSIKSGHSLPVMANIKGEVFLTVVTDDKEVKISTLPVKSNTSWVITKSGELKQLENKFCKNKENGRTNDKQKISEEVKYEYKTTEQGQTPILENSKGQNNDNKNEEQENVTVECKDTEEKSKNTNRTNDEQTISEEVKYAYKTTEQGQTPILGNSKGQNNDYKNEEQENASDQYIDTEDKSKNTNSLGEQQTCDERQNLLELVPNKSGPIIVKNKGLKWYNKIRGIDVTNNGTVLLIFYNNKNIKSVTADSKVLSVLSLPVRPRDITVLNATTGVVAADANRLYVIEITNDSDLSLGNEVKLPYTISAVTIYNGNLVVSCETYPVTTKLISLQGKETWSVSKNELGEELFSYPEGITTMTINNNVVIAVTDCEENTITLLEAKTGKFIRTINVEGKAPMNITIDNNGNAYVCYSNTNEICVWSNDFKRSNVLLKEEDIGKEPYCITYSAVDESIYVSFLSSEKSNTVDRFKLQFQNQ